MKTLAETTTENQLEEYQSRFVSNVRRVIETNWIRRRPGIRILDMGCDTSGRQLSHLAALTRGEVVGINIPDDFPSQRAIKNSGKRTTLIRMDGMDLSFPDSSFDLVISANVMEHVSDPHRYISEAARVTKSTGIAYFETAPVWSGPRGHHIHADMIRENCPGESNFRDDGSVVPDWSHLMFSEAKMRAHLEPILRPATVDYVVWYVYHSGDLNKAPWSQIENELHDAFPYTRIAPWPSSDVDTWLKPSGSNENYDVSGFSATCRKQLPNFLSRRICWRLRKLGL